MVSKIEDVWKWVSKTPLYRPAKILAAFMGMGTYPLRYFKVVEADAYLDRAIKRLGSIPKNRNGKGAFYSYFSEMWGEGYEAHLARQYEAYLPLLNKKRGSSFLDIGCGAGEFVSFLGEHGFDAQGIDLNEMEVARGVERGLNIKCGDALDFLREHTGEISGVSMLQVIEHLPIQEIQPLISEIFEALTPGGQILIETINTKHPLAFHTFYMDPTHVRPMPLDLMVFYLQWQGFRDVKVVYTAPIASDFQQLFDPSLAYFNYAVLGVK